MINDERIPEHPEKETFSFWDIQPDDNEYIIAVKKQIQAHKNGTGFRISFNLDDIDDDEDEIDEES